MTWEEDNRLGEYYNENTGRKTSSGNTEWWGHNPRTGWGSPRQKLGEFDELGNYIGGMPEGYLGKQAQYRSEQIVSHRNADLMQRAVDTIGQASQNALGLMESYRPGGAASLASGIQMQAGMGQANMLAASRTNAPDLLGNWREDRAIDARNRQDKMSYMQMGTQLLGAAIGAIGPGLFPGGAGKAPGTQGSFDWSGLAQAGVNAAGNVLAAKAGNTAGAEADRLSGANEPTGQAPMNGPVNQTPGPGPAQGPQYQPAPTPQQGPGAAPQVGPTQPGQPRGGPQGGPAAPQGGAGGGGGAPAGGGGGSGPMSMGGPTGAGGIGGAIGGGMAQAISSYGSSIGSTLSPAGTAAATLGGQDSGDPTPNRLLNDAQAIGRDTTVTMRANIMSDPDLTAVDPLRAYNRWIEGILYRDVFHGNMQSRGARIPDMNYGVRRPTDTYQVYDQ